MACSGTTDGENCGGRNKMTAYQYQYQGCYRDAIPRAMDAEGLSQLGDMTNEVSCTIERIVYCNCYKVEVPIFATEI